MHFAVWMFISLVAKGEKKTTTSVADSDCLDANLDSTFLKSFCFFCAELEADRILHFYQTDKYLQFFSYIFSLGFRVEQNAFLRSLISDEDPDPK